MSPYRPHTGCPGLPELESQEAMKHRHALAALGTATADLDHPEFCVLPSERLLVQQHEQQQQQECEPCRSLGNVLAVQADVCCCVNRCKVQEVDDRCH